jgi:hypothetical protein
MKMQLSNEQRELLSAYLDGEVNASEKALALALLEREEACAYLAGLKRVRELAQTHAAARAPRDLVSLVRQSLDGDFDGISRPTSNQGDYDSISRPTSNQLQLNAMPQASWRMPLMAMAAALVMAVGIFAVNSLIVPNDAPRDLSTAGRDYRKDPEAAPETREALRKSSQPELRDGPAEDPARELARPASSSPAKKPESSNSTDKYERKSGTESPRDAADEQNEEKKKGYAEGEGEDDARTKDGDHNSEGEKRENWGDGKAGGTGGAGGGGTRGTGKSEAGPAEGGETVRRARAKSEGSDSGKKQDGTRNDGGAPAQPAPELKDTTSEVEVKFAKRDGASPTVATDVLVVASSFGEATASSNDDGTVVEVEVAEDQVDELLAAINKLAQSKGEKAGEDLEAQPNKEAEAPRARDYLPKTLRDAVERAAEARKEKALEEPKPAAPAEAPAAPARKRVKVIVRLK